MLFTPPRYSQLSAPSYDAYLCLLTILLSNVPEVILEGSNDKECEDFWTDFCTKKHDVDLPTNLDSKTQARLTHILSSDHVCKLLKAADCPSKLISLATYLPRLCLSWPSQVCNVLDAVAISDATGFARLLYVEKVSDMPLGRTFIKNPVKLIGSLTFEHWARLLFFTDLFILLNQQMNDREFYGTTSESQPESKLRNPLDINQLQTFLKQLCTIIYDLDRVPEIGAHAPVTKGKIDWTRLTARLKGSLVVLLRCLHQPPEVSESGKETIQDDSDTDDAQSGMMSKEEVAVLLERAKSPREKLLGSDPTCFHEILAQLDLEDNITKFRTMLFLLHK
ncbi:hypothetical protein CPB84DRAFT_1857385 [Gymnopilus junonius]|uniref:Uncharacterized protein n=1 Tax=Gymnopilus junonius TaxID=109634 RepID=A0A9P5TFB6_GYMJU|nr:hypothetical protein CPB84DRAFT_1857385 [Gymnopilus junonius]